MLNENDPGVRRACLFTNGRSQAVRIPKEMAFDTREVLIKREGAQVIIEERKPERTLAEVVEWLRSLPPLPREERLNVDDGDLLQDDDPVEL